MTKAKPIFSSMQEAFDKTIEHFVRQKGRAMYNGVCSYLLQDGSMCAIGAHIPKGHKAQHHVGAIHSLFQEYSDIEDMLFCGNDSHESFNFWDLMQTAHDVSISVAEIQDALRDLARRFNLDASRVEDITIWNPGTDIFP